VLDDALAPADAAKEAAGGFGPLKTVLGAISAVYADPQVRLLPLFKTLL